MPPAVKVFGLSQTVALTRKVANAKETAYFRAVVMEGQLILTESQKQVPVRTGFLKNSKRFDVAKTKFGHFVNIGYTALYAMAVHEIQKSYRTGKWKYLEDPIKAATPGFASRVAARVARSP